MKYDGKAYKEFHVPYRVFEQVIESMIFDKMTTSWQLKIDGDKNIVAL